MSNHSDQADDRDAYESLWHSFIFPEIHEWFIIALQILTFILAIIGNLIVYFVGNRNMWLLLFLREFRCTFKTGQVDDVKVESVACDQLVFD